MIMVILLLPTIHAVLIMMIVDKHDYSYYEYSY